MAKRFGSWILVVLVCVGVAALFGLFKYNQIQTAIERGRAFPEPVEAVEPFTVEQITQHPTLQVSGEVVATRSAVLKNELKGRIVRVGFAPGARVSAGDVLLQLDISQEAAQLEEARASLKIAQLALQRAQRMVDRGAGSVETRDQSRAQFDAASARVEAFDAMIDKKTLRAPFDAIASLHELEAGQFLDAGTDITELVGVTDQIWIDFSLPQADANIPIGATVTIQAGRQGEPIDAQIVARDAAVNVRSRNLRMRAQVAADKVDLLPGMLVTVTVPLGSERLVTVVPATAVRRDALGSSVYVLEPVQEEGKSKTRARQRRVTLAPMRGNRGASERAIILSGLEAGEVIAAIGAFKLRDGALVMPGEAQPDAQDRLVGH